MFGMISKPITEDQIAWVVNAALSAPIGSYRTELTELAIALRRIEQQLDKMEPKPVVILATSD